MGQNFLTNLDVAAAIVDRSELTQSDSVLEIGAGLGALTVPLARRAKKVYAVEPDRRIAALLRNELLAHELSNVDVIEEDILACDLGRLAATANGSLKVIGNLPYHISSQVVVHLVTHRQFVSRAVLMFQKELAQRLLAGPGTKTYGRLSVLLRYCSRCRPLIDVAASSFYPSPGVDSAVVAIDFEETVPYPATAESFLFDLVRAGFGKRRKMLKNALKDMHLPLSESEMQAAFAEAGIDARRRAETLRVQEFVNLSNALTHAK
jgi:16S rRNA (adenine1518-N6/adenine1519-N6)-dimethyltransferase